MKMMRASLAVVLTLGMESSAFAIGGEAEYRDQQRYQQRRDRKR